MENIISENMLETWSWCRRFDDCSIIAFKLTSDCRRPVSYLAATQLVYVMQSPGYVSKGNMLSYEEKQMRLTLCASLFYWALFFTIGHFGH